MKKVISLLLSIIVISMCSFNVFAADVNSRYSGKTVITLGDWVYSAIDGGSHWELDEYIGEGGNIVIPRIVNDRMVVSIGSHCFLDNTTVKNVETSSPLWTVSDYAFLNCTSLESFECNFALKEIKVGAFYGTTSLKSINLEDSVVTVISPHAFTNSGITKIKLPETCTKLDNYSFAQCASLKVIDIPNSVTEISDTAFSGCSGLTIAGYSGSYAETYAAAKGIDFLNLDLLGDADMSGEVDVLDATIIQKYKIGRSELSGLALKYADVNRDGKVSVRDATLIQMKLAGMIDSYT